MDVPGDGNCWIYAAYLSLYSQNIRDFTIHPQLHREKMFNLFYTISNSSTECETNCRDHLCQSVQMQVSQFECLAILNNELNFTNVFQFISYLFKLEDHINGFGEAILELN